jgi:hypothetical protein
MKAINVNKLTSCGVHFIFWVADWFALLNNKIGGDLNKIQTVGRYMIEVFKRGNSRELYIFVGLEGCWNEHGKCRILVVI